MQTKYLPIGGEDEYSGRNNSNGTRGNSDKPPTLHRKSWNAWSICLQYAVSDCDLLFSIGTRFNDRITGKLHSFAPNAQIVHIDIDTAAISKNVQVDIPIVADAKMQSRRC